VTRSRKPEAAPAIPIIEAGADWAVETLTREKPRALALLASASGTMPVSAIRIADAVSRRWLARHDAAMLPELDRIAAIVGRPGGYYLNVSYEWGCSCATGAGPDGAPMLLRVLDWPDHGLGRHVIAVRVASALGGWVSMTWPGYAGVLQGVAPGRFAAALNQAPLDGPTGIYAFDWLASRAQVWRRPHVTASHLLRSVFETAPDYATARLLLRDTPIAAGAIYSLAGVAPGESCVIERRPETAAIIEGPAAAANLWQSPGWRGMARGQDNAARLSAMKAVAPSLDPEFGWLSRPVLNDRTRLVFVASAASGAFVAQGYEADGPATRPLVATA
jgi:hypothetical protein